MLRTGRFALVERAILVGLPALAGCAGVPIQIPPSLAEAPGLPFTPGSGPGNGHIGDGAFHDLSHALAQSSEKNVGDAGPPWRRSGYSFGWTGPSGEMTISCVARLRASGVDHNVDVEEEGLDCAARQNAWTLHIDAFGKDIGGTLAEPGARTVDVIGIFELASGLRTPEIVGFQIGEGAAVSLLNRPTVWESPQLSAVERDCAGAAAFALVTWRDVREGLIADAVDAVR